MNRRALTRSSRAMSARRLACTGWLALILCQQWPAVAQAARLLTATVECDGLLVLRTAYQDDGRQAAGAVWQYLGRKPLWSEGATTIVADTADPRQATLQGNLVIRLQHGDRTIVAARADTLRLARTDTSSQDWFLAPGEVERIGRDNGLPLAPSHAIHTSQLGLLVLAGIAMAAGAIAVLWIFVRRSQHCD